MWGDPAADWGPTPHTARRAGDDAMRGGEAGSAHVGLRFAVLKVGREMFEEGTGIGEEPCGTAPPSTEWVPGESRPEQDVISGRGR